MMPDGKRTDLMPVKSITVDDKADTRGNVIVLANMPDERTVALTFVAN